MMVKKCSGACLASASSYSNDRSGVLPAPKTCHTPIPAERRPMLTSISRAPAVPWIMELSPRTDRASAGAGHISALRHWPGCLPCACRRAGPSPAPSCSRTRKACLPNSRGCSRESAAPARRPWRVRWRRRDIGDEPYGCICVIPTLIIHGLHGPSSLLYPLSSGLIGC